MEKVFSEVISLPDSDAGIQNSIVRFSNAQLDSTKSNKNKFFRREPVLIQSSKGKIIRFAMGNPGTVKGLSNKSIAIDYDGFDALGITFPQSKDVHLTVKKANLLEIIHWFSNHPDLLVRLNTRFALIGLLLGITGFLVAVLSLL